MKYHLFEVFGIELEYMLVKNQQLKVAPIVDQLMVSKMGYVTADADNGAIEWSNELVAHVVELKTNGPTPNLKNLSKKFHKNVNTFSLGVKSKDRISSLNTKWWIFIKICLEFPRFSKK